MKVTIKKRWLIPAAAVLVLLILGTVVLMRGGAKRASAEGAAVRTAEVTRQDITATLSASGTLSPKDTYSIPPWRRARWWRRPSRRATR